MHSIIQYFVVWPLVIGLWSTQPPTTEVKLTTYYKEVTMILMEYYENPTSTMKELHKFVEAHGPAIRTLADTIKTDIPRLPTEEKRLAKVLMQDYQWSKGKGEICRILSDLLIFKHGMDQSCNAPHMQWLKHFHDFIIIMDEYGNTPDKAIQEMNSYVDKYGDTMRNVFKEIMSGKTTLDKTTQNEFNHRMQQITKQLTNVLTKTELAQHQGFIDAYMRFFKAFANQ